jgi:hypothetical protein
VLTEQALFREIDLRGFIYWYKTPGLVIKWESGSVFQKKSPAFEDSRSATVMGRIIKLDMSM